MQCAQCQGVIEPDSRFCRHCGAGQPPANGSSVSDPEVASAPEESGAFNWRVLLLGVVGAAIVLVFIQAVLSTGASIAPGLAESQVAVGAPSDTAAVDATSQDQSLPKSNWSYSTDEDRVRGGTTYLASTTSTNFVYQDPPYDASTTMDVVIRKSPAYGTDVILVISSGQMMCPSYEGCSGTVRFDDGPAQRISFNGPADNSSDSVFVIGTKSFIAKLRKAKRLVVEKTLYEAGNPQFEFNVEGLKWEH